MIRRIRPRAAFDALGGIAFVDAATSSGDVPRISALSQLSGHDVYLYEP